jgi:hypothetical protein
MGIGSCSFIFVPFDTFWSKVRDEQLVGTSLPKPLENVTTGAYLDSTDGSVA